jgi:ribosome-binding protein aMBF1 (putative translation factor)
MSERMPNDVAQLIARARLRLGWSYRRAAQACGTSCGYVHMLEHGVRCPSVVMAESLISGLKLSADDAESLRRVSLSGVGRDFDLSRFRIERNRI